MRPPGTHAARHYWSGAKPTTDEQREQYAERFVRACRDKRLRAVAITDHHDFAFIDFVRDAAHAEQTPAGKPIPPHLQLVVFPGLELTLAVPCQALLLLDADFPSDRLANVLERLNIEASDPATPSHATPVRLAFENLQELHDRLDERQWLKGRYVVLPNVTDGGLGTLMRSGMAEKYKTMPCVGGYIDGDAASKVGAGNANIFAGNDASRGNKSIAYLQTSDSRSEDFAQLGAHSSWVKWAVPTAEAIRRRAWLRSRGSVLLPHRCRRLSYPASS